MILVQPFAHEFDCALIAITPHHSIGNQIWIKTGTRGCWIRFESDTCDTHVFTVQSRVVNPRPKALVMSQGASNLQPKVAGVRIDEARCYPSIASVPMY